MNETYKCNKCQKTFEKLIDGNKCPFCESTEIEKSIPIFFGLNPTVDDSACEGGVCSFDKNKS